MDNKHTTIRFTAGIARGKAVTKAKLAEQPKVTKANVRRLLDDIDKLKNTP